MLIATVTKEKKKYIYIYIYWNDQRKAFFFMTNIHQRKALNHQLA